MDDVYREEAPPHQARESARFDFAVPMVIELSRGLLRPAEQRDAILVDLSEGGAAIVTRTDSRFKPNKRFRVRIDDHAGIIELRNVVHRTDGMVRLGVEFKSLGLELQEIVADSLHAARHDASRIDHGLDPFVGVSETGIFSGLAP